MSVWYEVRLHGAPLQDNSGFTCIPSLEKARSLVSCYIERLEKLCMRMYRLLEYSAKFPATVSGIEPTRREMQDLGLLEGDQE